MPATERFDGRVRDATCGGSRGSTSAKGMRSNMQVRKAGGGNKAGQDRGEERIRNGVAQGVLKEGLNESWKRV